MAYRSSIRDDLTNIHQFTGDIYYVSPSGSDVDNVGYEPDLPFKSITKALDTVGVGDAIVIGAGNYTESGLTLDTNFVEMWFEIGAQISPPSGDGLTVTSDFNRVISREGALKINNYNAGAIGVKITGDFCYMAEVRVANSNTGMTGFQITGDGSDLRRCRTAEPTKAAFDIQGDVVKLEDCCCGGDELEDSYGFWVRGTSDRVRIKHCGTQGFSLGGVVLESGTTNGVVESFYSGGGDGKFQNNATSNNSIISNLHYQGDSGEYNSPITKVVTFQAGVTQYNLFKVTGIVRVVNISGEVLSALPATSTVPNLELTSTNASIDITDATGGPDISGAVDGALLIRNAESTEPLDFANPDSTPAIAENTGGGLFNPSSENSVVCVEDDSVDTYITLNLTTAMASGTMIWACWFNPISVDGFVEPA